MPDVRTTSKCVACVSTALGSLVATGVVVLADLPGQHRRPTGPTVNCVTSECHTAVLDHQTVHAPVAQRKCAACHVEDDPEAHTFSIPGDPSALCLTCHSRQERTYAHEPVREGNCTGCHDPHGSDHPQLLVADPTGGLCLTCHQEHVDAAFVHGPVATGACILCHEPHSSWEPALLVEPPPRLCLTCHEEIEPDPDLDRYVHAPAMDDCLACHDAHASEARYQLRESAPGLCYRCHAEELRSLENAAVVHGAIVQEGGCLACHNAHASPLPSLLAQEEIDLCLDCHGRSLTATDGHVLPDMAALLETNPDHHGPIRDGACTVCHLPHVASEHFLLRKAYPAEFYAPYEPARYALCFECHIPGMVGSEHGTGVTGFRQGDLNLHWLHVNRTKGRTCRACHEVHASRNPFHIRDSVPFGNQGWALPIGFRREATGGSCSPGCHQMRSYDREAAPAPAAGSSGDLPAGSRSPAGGHP